jgi:acyl carrier protein
MADPKLRQVIADALELPSSAITAEADTETLEAWDSLGHLKVILAIEGAYGVQFTTAEIRELISVERLQVELRRRNAL